MKNYLAIDQGTTSSRAIIFDANLKLINDAQKEYDLTYPNDGWVELDPLDVIKTVKETVNNVLKKHKNIEACGITNQRETTIIWSRTSGIPIYSAIVWQDRRTHEYCNKLKSEGYEDLIKEKTGLLLDPYFSATKIKWILDNVDGAKSMAEKGDLLFGTIDSYLIYVLSKESFAVGERSDLAILTSNSDCPYSISAIINSGLFFFEISLASFKLEGITSFDL